MTCPTEIKQRIDEAVGVEPRLAVVAVRRLRSEDLPWLEERAVRFARAQGYSWARLGRLLGRSRQATQKRFAPIDGTPQPMPRRTMHDDTRFMIRRWSRRADERRWNEFVELEAADAVPW